MHVRPLSILPWEWYYFWWSLLLMFCRWWYRLSSDLGPLHKNIEDDKKLSSRRIVTHGFHLVKGNMDHGMEDYIVAEKRQINGNELGLYAIFYGHSGKQVAEYLHSHLFDNILQKAWAHLINFSILCTNIISFFQILIML